MSPRKSRAEDLEHIDLRVAPDVGAVLSVRVTKELALALIEEARARGVKMSDIIREAIERRHGPWTQNSAATSTTITYPLPGLDAKP